MTAASMAVVSEKGIESLTAQELRNILKCSASPIFTVFHMMKEIQDEVRIAAMKRFEQYEVAAVSDMPIFKQICIDAIEKDYALTAEQAMMMLIKSGVNVK